MDVNKVLLLYYYYYYQERKQDHIANNDIVTYIAQIT